MESKLVSYPPEDGIEDEAIPSTDVVHFVLSQNKRKPTVLKNISIFASTSKPTKSQLEAQLEAHKAGNVELRCAIEELQQVNEFGEAERLKYLEDLQVMRKKQEDLRKKQEEANALIQQVLAHLSEPQQAIW